MSETHGPSHYIAQPRFQVGTGKMQKNLIARRNKKSAAFDVNGQERVEHFSANHKTSQKANETQGGEDNQVESVEVVEKKPFKEMNIDERIDFLLHRPFYIPASPCEIKTEQQSYFGYIEKYDGGEITLRHLNEKEILSIERREVTEVLLLRM